jgi:hypothetical protein
MAEKVQVPPAPWARSGIACAHAATAPHGRRDLHQRHNAVAAPGELRRRVAEIGADPMPQSVQTQQTAADGGQIVGSPQTVVVGGPVVDTVRRGVWIAQLVVIARRFWRRRLLLLVDICE